MAGRRSSSSSATIQRVRDPVRDLAALVDRLTSESEGLYDFLPPLAECHVVAFERRSGIALPEEHRRFLREVSAGGRPTRLGPPHAMTLAEAARAVKREGGRLDAEFPLTAADAKRLIRADARTPSATRPAIRRDLTDGVLPLMDLGGGEMDFIVVTGPQRGCIWRAWDAGWSPLWGAVHGKPWQRGFFSWLRFTLG
jgi:hypothetical protein